jgi:hypothetical protein
VKTGPAPVRRGERIVSGRGIEPLLCATVRGSRGKEVDDACLVFRDHGRGPDTSRSVAEASGNSTVVDSQASERQGGGALTS